MARWAVLCGLVGALACGGSEKDPNPPGGGSGDGASLGTAGDGSGGGSGSTDDGEEDGFEVEGLKGHIPQDAINRTIQKNAGAIDGCYRKKLAGRRYVGGSVELAFVVQQDGSVAKVSLKKSDLGDWAMEKCLLSVGQAMSFVEPKGGKEAEFSIPVEFEPRKQPLWWNQARIDTELEGKLDELAACAERGSPPSDALITAYVIRRGAIPSVGFAAPQGDLSEEWVECAIEVVKGWALSDPRGRIAKLSFRFGG